MELRWVGKGRDDPLVAVAWDVLLPAGIGFLPLFVLQLLAPASPENLEQVATASRDVAVLSAIAAGLLGVRRGLEYFLAGGVSLVLALTAVLTLWCFVALLPPDVEFTLEELAYVVAFLFGGSVFLGGIPFAIAWSIGKALRWAMGYVSYRGPYG